MNKLSLYLLLVLHFILECISYPFFLVGYLILGDNKYLTNSRFFFSAPFFLIGLVIMSPVQFILDRCYPTK